MTLGETQQAFSFYIGTLLVHMNTQVGFRARLKEVFRTDEQAIIHAMGAELRAELADYLDNDPRWQGLALAIANNGKGRGVVFSNHRVALAADIDLFRSGEYVKDTEGHRYFGEYWEKLHPLARWGGRFGDGNHYSFEWGGRK